MKPSDIFALPSREVEPWWDSYYPFEVFVEENAYSFDREVGEKQKANRLTFAEKLYASSDGDRGARFVAVEFDGQPICLLTMAGKSAEGDNKRYVTDLAGYQAAMAYLSQFHASLHGDQKVHDANEDIEALDRIYGYHVKSLAGQITLVPEWHMANDGTVIFDDKAYHAAFEEIVRPAFKDRDKGWEEGLKNPQMKELATQAILAGIPEGVRHTPDFDMPLGTKGGDWHAVLVGTDEGTYTMGIWSMYSSAKWFAWASHITRERIGGPELYNELAKDPAPAGMAP